LLRLAAVTASIVTAAACGRSVDPPYSPAIKLTSPQSGRAYVEVTGLPPDALGALAKTSLTNEEGRRASVAVDDTAPGMLGDSASPAASVHPRSRSIPALSVRSIPRLPGAGGLNAPIVPGWTAGADATPSTVVTRLSDGRCGAGKLLRLSTSSSRSRWGGRAASSI
jgi:hypothetical protein